VGRAEEVNGVDYPGFMLTLGVHRILRSKIMVSSINLNQNARYFLKKFVKMTRSEGSAPIHHDVTHKPHVIPKTLNFAGLKK